MIACVQAPAPWAQRRHELPSAAADSAPAFTQARQPGMFSGHIAPPATARRAGAHACIVGVLVRVRGRGRGGVAVAVGRGRVVVGRGRVAQHRGGARAGQRRQREESRVLGLARALACAMTQRLATGMRVSADCAAACRGVAPQGRRPPVLPLRCCVCSKQAMFPQRAASVELQQTSPAAPRAAQTDAPRRRGAQRASHQRNTHRTAAPARHARHTHTRGSADKL